jgi:hypothetical protein
LTFRLLVLVAGYGTCGFLHPALGLLLHGSTPSWAPLLREAFVVLEFRGGSALSVVFGFALALLLALLATLLLLVPSLLLAFLTLLLLLATAAGETPYEALRLVGYPSDGVLRPLHGLPSLLGSLPCGILRSSLVLLLLLASSTLGLGGARRLLCGLFGLGGRRNLQVEEAAILTELQADEGAWLVYDGARRLSLLVGGPLSTLGPRQIGYVAHYLLIDRVAFLVDGFLDYVALLVDGALDGLTLLVDGRFAEQLGTGGDVLGYLADLINSPSCGVLNLLCGLASGVLDPLHGLSGLVGDAPKRALILLVLLPLLLLLVAFAHFRSPFGKAIVVVVGLG